MYIENLDDRTERLMQFNSYGFILFFLPVTVLLYFFANKIKLVFGKLVIIIASIIFYSWGRINMLLYLGISLLINYGSALVIKKWKIRNRMVLALPIIVNVGMLVYFKYLNFAISNINALFGKEFPLQNIILPLGISFYTFQQIAYIVATEQGELENNDLIDYMASILYFPKLVMGPIIDPVDYILQLNQSERKKVNLTNLAVGIKIFSLGLLKKVLIADTFANAVSWGYTNIDAATSMDCLLLVLFYTFEIYFDFSGYSDMAVGISSMLNIDLPMNFDSPYKAVSIRDFWKRWHISLTKFLTKYIYIPLGGSRKGDAFTYLNTLIVFLVSGLWHGDNWTFVLWGLFAGLIMVIEGLIKNPIRNFAKKHNINYHRPLINVIRRTLVFSILIFSAFLFRAQNISQIGVIYSRIFTSFGFGVDYFNAALSSLGMKVIDILEIALILGVMYKLYDLAYDDSFIVVNENGQMAINKNKYFKNIIICLMVVAVALGWFMLISKEAVSQFVYFQF